MLKTNKLKNIKKYLKDPCHPVTLILMTLRYNIIEQFISTKFVVSLCAAMVVTLIYQSAGPKFKYRRDFYS